MASVPISYYRVDEPAGPIAADLMGANVGTYFGGVTFSQSSLLSSDADACVKFDGSTGYVLCKSGRILSGLTNWSIVAWVKTTFTGAFDTTIYSERAGVGVGNDILKMDMITGPPFKLELVYRDDAGTLNRPATTSVTLNDGVSHMCGITKAGTAVTLYQDGLQAGSGVLTATNTFTDAGVESRIGSDQAAMPDGTWRDFIDEVAIYSRVLTPQEIQYQYAVGVSQFSGEAQGQYVTHRGGRGAGW